MLYYCTDKDKIAELLQEKEDNISKLSDLSFSSLSNVLGMAKVFIKYKKDLTADDVALLLKKAKDREPLFPEPF